jgi:hypothetical protein
MAGGQAEWRGDMSKKTQRYQTKGVASEVDYEFARFIYLAAAHHYAGVEEHECEDWELEELNQHINISIKEWKAQKDKTE